MNKDFEITNFANTVATEKHQCTKYYWLSANAHDVISLQDGESCGSRILTFFFLRITAYQIFHTRNF